MPEARSILHLDMDAFFASVEQLDDPKLRGKPVLVGHDGVRGVVAAASYEARRWGCHSAQPMGVAKRKCPHAVVVPVRGARYRELSDRMFSILEAFSPLIEPLSIDEAFLDVTGSDRLFGTPEQVARRIKDRVSGELHLTASVGVAPNKFLAKLASDLEKPDGLVVIKSEDIDAVLLPLSVTKLWGVGPATAAKLQAMGIRTIRDLRRASREQLKRRFRDEAEHFVRLAHGTDDRPVVTDRQAKSIGHEQTFSLDIEDPDEVRRVLLEQVEQVARRLRKHRMRARSVALKIRYGDFQTISRSVTLERFTHSTSDLWSAAKSLFNRWASQAFEPVRLIGMTAEKLSENTGQMDLFHDSEQDRQQRVDQAMDCIVDRFGERAIRRGK